MWQVLIASWQDPIALRRCAGLPRRSAFFLFFILSTIISLPWMTTGARILSDLSQDWRTTSPQIPDFAIVDNTLTLKNAHQPLYINGRVLFFALDTTIDHTNKELLNRADDALFSVTLLSDGFTMSVLQQRIFAAPYRDIPDLTPQRLSRLLDRTISPTWSAIALAGAALIGAGAVTLAMYLLLFSLAATVLFAWKRLIVSWRYLWRASLFASVVPITLTTISTLIGIPIMHQTILLVACVTFLHYRSLSDIIANRPKDH